MNSPVPVIAPVRGSYTGAPLCEPRAGKRFYQCPICGGWVDSTDLKQVAEHEGNTPLTAALPTDAAQAS
jgi:hypothetical protein